MNEHFKQYLRSTTSLHTAQIEQIADSFHLKKAARGTLLLSSGEICRTFYYVAGGSFRTYFLTADGQQHTRMIAMEGAAGTALTSFIRQQPSMEFIEVLEDAELYTISHANFRCFLATIPGWAEFYNQFLETAYLQQHEKLQDHTTLNASRRYQKILETRPEYIQRLSNKVLASYLDIREETLSRLKSK